MSKRTKEILKLAARQGVCNNNSNEDINNIVSVNNFHIVENVNIEIIDYQSLFSDDKITTPPLNENYYDVMESDIMSKRTKDILKFAARQGVCNIIQMKILTLLCPTEIAKGEQGTGKHVINNIIYKENTAGTSRFETKESASAYDISDDSDYDTLNLVPYSETDSSSDEMPTKTKTRRKRFKVVKATWFSEKNKNRRENGKQYFGRTKSLYWGENKVFVDSTVKSEFIKRARDRKVPEQSRRNQTFKYYLKTGDQEIRVCRTMYLNTVGLGHWSIQNWKNTFSNYEKADDAEKNSKNNNCI
ncbi:unnamed protein product [Psylliodes chrysocephalus]|uniref:Uncharacterized protein n=1 Tax=Psylliodes chrysocephalus TaxID=3402493 RepID=A0A9P0CX53_9CUCU|nr:unnamed protein product [Psylliodes chrysocephala]